MDQFEKRSELAIYWFNKSSDLRGSAAALWTSQDGERSDAIVQECRLGQGFIMAAAVGSVFWMLCGMSLELLYKAIIVAKGEKAVHSHDLVKLAKLVGLHVGKKTETVLEILTESIIWYGRYPVPKTKELIENLNDLLSDFFYEDAPPGKFKIRKTNVSLSWNLFNSLWLDGRKIYLEYTS
jgi:hypothetical protein